MAKFDPNSPIPAIHHLAYLRGFPQKCLVWSYTQLRHHRFLAVSPLSHDSNLIPPMKKEILLLSQPRNSNRSHRPPRNSLPRHQAYHSPTKNRRNKTYNRTLCSLDSAILKEHHNKTDPCCYLTTSAYLVDFCYMISLCHQLTFSILPFFPSSQHRRQTTDNTAFIPSILVSR